jgi:hypothetical protein
MSKTKKVDFYSEEWYRKHFELEEKLNREGRWQPVSKKKFLEVVDKLFAKTSNTK